MDSSPTTLSESGWEPLLDAITNRRCTPIIGAGALAGILPLGSEIAARWAEQYNYPMRDSRNLARVAQFVSVVRGQMMPKESLARELEKSAQPNFADPGEPYNVLASLPLSLYITTNYDDFLARALEWRGKNPRRAISRWNRWLRSTQEETNDYNYRPSIAEPMVFHLHGRIEQPESLVLTEDDYLDFIINLGRDQDILPSVVQMACSTNLLLFLGYRLDDWAFRVLLRSLGDYIERSMRRQHIAVMLAPPALNSSEQRVRAVNYLDKQFGNLGMRIYWGTIREFAAELRKRLERL
jgi:hypothetical protein